MKLRFYLIIFLMIISIHFLESVIFHKKIYFNGHCTDSFIHCSHVCVPSPDNTRQFYCTCRSQYYIQEDGSSCKKTPPKDLEMDFEINQGLEENPETPKPQKKTTNFVYTRSKRYTRRREKTPKPVLILPKGKCTATFCQNGGICQSTKSGSSNNHVMYCLCRLGFDGLACERNTAGIRFPKFTPNGYIAFQESILKEQEFRLSIYVKPALLMAGTVVAFKNSPLSFNFILGIEGSTFVFRFENRTSQKEIRHQTLVVSTKDRWYKLEIERRGNDGKLFVDNVQSNLSIIELPKEPVTRFRPIVDKNEELTSSFVCDHCLYVGGHPQLLNTVKQNHNLFGFIESTYIGCMRNLVINTSPIDMRRMPYYGQALEGLGIEDCSVGVCDSISCQNKGECDITDDYKPVCHCNFGFAGKLCTIATSIRMPSFTGQSYITYPGLRGTSRSENHIYIHFKPLSGTGILLYQGYSNNRRGDFLAIYLINGYPWISFDLGSGTISLRSKHTLTLGEWHNIRFKRIGRKGTLTVNDDDSVTGYSPGEQVQLTIRQNLLLGGIDSLDNVSAYLSVKTGFQGCIQMLFLDNEQVNLVEEVEKSRNIANCDSHSCGNIRSICWINGDCIPDKHNFSCSCPLGFTEAYCQTKIPISSIRNPSFNGSSYLVYTDQIILKKLSASRFNISLIFNLRTNQSSRFILHATRTSKPNNVHDVSLKINHQRGLDFVLSNGHEFIETTVARILPLHSDHRIQILKNRNKIFFHFNNAPVQSINLQYNSLSNIGFSKLYIGGSDLPTAISNAMPIQSGIIGCIKHLSFDSQPIKVIDANDGRSVAECSSMKTK